MRHVVFVAPRFFENTVRYVRAFASLPGAHASVVSEDPLEALPREVRRMLGSHFRVRSCLDPSEIERAVRILARAVGPVDRIAAALEQLQVPVAQVREAVGIEGMRVQTALAFRDKDLMKRRLREAGVPVAPSRLCTSLAEIRAFADEVGFPLVVKPRAGLGARATMRVQDLSDLEALGEPQDEVQVEKLVEGREMTCETVTVRGTPSWRSGTRYLPGPLEVLEHPWIQYAVLLPREVDDPDFRRFDPINEAALRALGLVGDEGTALTHMEWFLCEDGRMLVSEVGARPPGVQIMPLMSLAHAFDAVAAWAELVTFDRFDPPARRFAAGAAFFRAQGRGARVRAVTGWDDARREVGEALVDFRLPTPGHPRASGYEGEGWALVRSRTTEG
ncbi:MAG: ATP-grasp domain-containing protein, partial [Myxococcales bacterium]|nr:ATP-grasp domain-containing protein [Myxococcales bacterium]